MGYQDQTTLAEKYYEQQKQLAQQEKSDSIQALRAQLALQRTSMQSSRQQLGEQGWQSQRAIQQQAQARGLGSSGLSSLAHIQSQIAQGSALNFLETSNAAVQKEAMDTQRALNKDYQNAMLTADIAYQERMAAAENEKTSVLSTLYEAAMGGATDEQIAGMAAAAGYDASDFSEPQWAAIQRQAFDPSLSVSYKDKWDWGKIAQDAGLAASTASAVTAATPAMPIAAALGLVGGGGYGILSEATGNFGQGEVTLTDSNNNKTQYASWDAAIADVKSKYASNSYIASGAITVVKSGNSIKFSWNGVKYKTLNEAIAAIENKDTGD